MKQRFKRTREGIILGSWEESGDIVRGSLKMPRRRQGHFGEDYRRQALQPCGKPELCTYASYRSMQNVLTHMERALALVKQQV